MGERRLALALLGVLCIGAQEAWAGERQLSGWVVDGDGLVPNAEVRLVALRPEPCPCEKPGQEPMFEFPWCACRRPSWWVQRLATCPAPARALTRTRSDAKGRFSLPLIGSGNALEVESEKGVRWLALPRTSHDVSINLGPIWSTPIELTFPEGRPAEEFPTLRAGLVFRDGHCVPLARQGKLWAPLTPVPEALEEDMILGATGSNLAPVADGWTFGLEIRLALPLWTTIRENCEAPKTPATSATWVTWTSPFHDPRKVRAAQDGSFVFEHVPDVPATMTCERQDARDRRWSYTPELGLSLEGLTGPVPPELEKRPTGPKLAPPGSEAGFLHGVVIVDQRGAPVPGAWVQTSQGRVGRANQQGRLHGKIPDKGMLDVTHPGGRCFGHVSLAVPAPQDSPRTRALVRITLPVTKHPRSPLRGRVLSSEGRPLADAAVTIENAHLGNCDDQLNDYANTSPDGRFTLPALPHGQYTLDITHPDYAGRLFQMAHPGKPAILVMDRGASWSGRVYDPEGRVLTPNLLRILSTDDKTDSAQASSRPRPGQPFLLRHLGSGKTILGVSVKDDPLLGSRVLIVERELAALEQRQEDIHWPAGHVTLAGQVVDGKTGAPLADVKIIALPKGLSLWIGQRQTEEVDVVSDHEGRFAFRHMADKTWVLYVRDKEVAEVSTTKQDLRLSAPPP